MFFNMIHGSQARNTIKDQDSKYTGHSVISNYMGNNALKTSISLRIIAFWEQGHEKFR